MDFSSIHGIADTDLTGVAESGRYMTQRQGSSFFGNPNGSPAVILSLNWGDQANLAATYSKEQILEQKRDKGAFGSDQAGTGGAELSEEEEQMVRELEARDREVRRHEQTHVAMLGRYARGGPTYVYQTGPDGKLYAVGGSVEVETGKEATPEATAAKARTLRMAATGVAEPSAADMAIAGHAVRVEAQAMRESFS